MISKKEDSGPAFAGGPAFPTVMDYNEVGGKILVDAGMSLRDYFAGLAMQGWISTYAQESVHPANMDARTKRVAEYSYDMADAMLRAREAK